MDLITSLENLVKFAAHIANSSDSIREEEWENKIGPVGSRAVEVDMSVHIP
jgi:hypothetical protein